jgi:hypothetical protein
VRDNNPATRAFDRQYKITYPSITTSGEALLAFGPELPASAVPSTINVDHKGRIAARIIGATTDGTLSALMETLAEQKVGQRKPQCRGQMTRFMEAATITDSSARSGRDLRSAPSSRKRRVVWLRSSTGWRCWPVRWAWEP